MDLQRAMYEKEFVIRFLSSRGEQFQALFSQLMSKAYPTDFMPCRPWGKTGDQKNDGFLPSERRLFQVYAPDEMNAQKAIAKISEDFEGAKLHWEGKFDKWCFVHNAQRGLSPQIINVLLDLKNANPEISVEHWGFEELKVVFRKLSLEALSDWFGVVPTEETLSQVGFQELRTVLESISAKATQGTEEVKDVPAGKIEANALSESVVLLIKAGMSKAPLVDQFFQQWYDETYGERIAKAFTAKYQALKTEQTPSVIFSELQLWAGGGTNQTPEIQVAVLAVLAYFFERCDIYEEPRGIDT